MKDNVDLQVARTLLEIAILACAILVITLFSDKPKNDLIVDTCQDFLEISE